MDILQQRLWFSVITEAGAIHDTADDFKICVGTVLIRRLEYAHLQIRPPSYPLAAFFAAHVQTPPLRANPFSLQPPDRDSCH